MTRDPAEAVPPIADGPEPYWKCVVAAAPQLLVCSQFLLARNGIALFGMDARSMSGVMVTEAIALWAGLVIGMLWVFLSGGPVRRTARNWHIVLVIAAGAGAAYALGAAETILFLVMIVVTYFGLVMTWRHPAALLQLGSRWLAAYAALVVATTLCGTPEEILKWEGDPRAVNAGVVYFFLIAAVELTGLHLRIIPENRERITAALRGLAGKS